MPNKISISTPHNFRTIASGTFDLRQPEVTQKRASTNVAWIGTENVWSAARLQGEAEGRDDKSAQMYSAFDGDQLSWP
jgi:hypothetical protein